LPGRRVFLQARAQTTFHEKWDVSLRALKLLDLSADDELKLLEQVRALGGLDTEQLEFEVSRLVKHKKELFKLADAAKIKYKPTVKPETIAKKLVLAGRRYYENTGGEAFLRRKLSFHRFKSMLHFIPNDPFPLLFLRLKRHVLINEIKFSAIRNSVNKLGMVNHMPYKIKGDAHIPFHMFFLCHFFIPFLNFSLYHSHLSLMSCSA